MTQQMAVGFFLAREFGITNTRNLFHHFAYTKLVIYFIGLAGANNWESGRIHMLAQGMSDEFVALMPYIGQIFAGNMPGAVCEHTYTHTHTNIVASRISNV
jgi:hypothetical protein